MELLNMHGLELLGDLQWDVAMVGNKGLAGGITVGVQNPSTTLQ